MKESSNSGTVFCFSNNSVVSMRSDWREDGAKYCQKRTRTLMVRENILVPGVKERGKDHCDRDLAWLIDVEAVGFKECRSFG